MTKRDDEKKHLRELAKSGDDTAQFALGEIYEFAAALNDAERKRNRKLAMHYYQAAAQRGHPEAVLRYGLGCEQGYLGIKEEKTAFQYYTKAAEYRNIRAHYEMARCLESGIGTPVDHFAAMKKYSTTITLIQGVIDKVQQNKMSLTDPYSPDLNELGEILKKAREAIKRDPIKPIIHE